MNEGRLAGRTECSVECWLLCRMGTETVILLYCEFNQVIGILCNIQVVCVCECSWSCPQRVRSNGSSNTNCTWK